MAVNGEVVPCCLLVLPTPGGQGNNSKLIIALPQVMVKLSPSTGYYRNLE